MKANKLTKCVAHVREVRDIKFQENRSYGKRDTP